MLKQWWELRCFLKEMGYTRIYLLAILSTYQGYKVWNLRRVLDNGWAILWNVYEACVKKYTINETKLLKLATLAHKITQLASRHNKLNPSVLKRIRGIQSYTTRVMHPIASSALGPAGLVIDVVSVRFLENEYKYLVFFFMDLLVLCYVI